MRAGGRRVSTPVRSTRLRDRPGVTEVSPIRIAAGAAAMIIVLGVAGCAGIVTPSLEQSLPAHWRHAVEDDAPAVDLRGWWHAFHDQQLDMLVDEALRDNQDLASAHEHLLAARALAQGEGAKYRPYVRAKTEDAIDPDASASFLVAGFDAIWEFPLFGRGQATHEQAQGALDEKLASLQSARVSLVAEVVREWLQLRAAQQRTVMWASIRDARARQLQLLQVRQQLKLVSPAAIAKAQAALAIASASATEPAQEADAHAQNLAALLGRDAPDPSWLELGKLPELGQLTLVSTPADMLRARPDIALAQAGVLSALGDARLARANRFPSIGIAGSIVWSTNLTAHRRTSDAAIGSIGPAIEIPLFDWGLRESELDAQNHQLKAAAYAYRQAVLNGVTEVENALGQLEQARVQELANDAAARTLEQVQALTDQRVRLGLESPLDRYDGVEASAQARLEATTARISRGLAFVHLYKALGGAPLPTEQEVH